MYNTYVKKQDLMDMAREADLDMDRDYHQESEDTYVKMLM